MKTATYQPYQVVRRVRVSGGFGETFIDSVKDNLRSRYLEEGLDIDKAEVRILAEDVSNVFRVPTEVIYFVWNFIGDE